ncbi:MAG: alpha-N-arabinofuranosidase [Bacteroidales bacterium]|nr:alpha-N-arabinofuranosidase [Bacteroidales bacterium]
MKNIIAATLIIISACCAFAQESSKISINPNVDNLVINKHIYGHFSEHLGRCIYDGFWVNEHMNIPKDGRIRLDIVEALRNVKIPNLRWPGGCFADEYHWRDGVGPNAQRPTLINTTWGNVTEDNSFGTHEFLDLCALLQTEPIICGNVGTGSPQEMASWVEYLNFEGKSPMTDLRKENGQDDPWNVQFVGIGNESWGCGGSMRPEYYADLYRQFNNFVENYPNARVNRIAAGANVADYNWTEVLMREIGPRRMWGLSLHYYTHPRGGSSPLRLDYSLGNETPEATRGRSPFGGPGGRSGFRRLSGSATDFDEETYYVTMQNCLRMDELIREHSRIMDKYDPDKRVALVVDEWGIWTDVEPGTNRAFLYQQNSMRDALIAGSTLNVFNNHCDRVRMANLAQTVNVLQALILTKDEKMLLTPTYHVFDLYKVHHDAKYLPIQLETPAYSMLGYTSLPAVNASASQDESGTVNITFVNIDPNQEIPVEASLAALGLKIKSVKAKVLTSKNITDINSFDNPEYIKTVDFSGAKTEGNLLKVKLPAKSVVLVSLK